MIRIGRKYAAISTAGVCGNEHASSDEARARRDTLERAEGVEAGRKGEQSS